MERDAASGNTTTTPDFPSLRWPPTDQAIQLTSLYDVWRFTLLWTLIIYAIFHMGAAGIALVMQVGKAKKSNWKYLWLVPLLYAFVAGAEALFAGSLVGAVSVVPNTELAMLHTDIQCSVGAAYFAGNYNMSTWIPFIWGWVNVLILILSSFSIQGGM
jgi:hypothetical protein